MLVQIGSCNILVAFSVLDVITVLTWPQDWFKFRKKQTISYTNMTTYSCSDVIPSNHFVLCDLQQLIEFQDATFENRRSTQPNGDCMKSSTSKSHRGNAKWILWTKFLDHKHTSISYKLGSFSPKPSLFLKVKLVLVPGGSSLLSIGFYLHAFDVFDPGMDELTHTSSWHSISEYCYC